MDEVQRNRQVAQGHHLRIECLESAYFWESPFTCIGATTLHHIFIAIYNEYGGAVEIQTGKVISGELPKRVKKLIREWAKLHEAELLQNWEFARNEEELVNIEPLE